MCLLFVLSQCRAEDCRSEQLEQHAASHAAKVWGALAVFGRHSPRGVHLFTPVANLVVNDRRFSLSLQGFNNLELPVRHLLSFCIKARKTNESAVEKIVRQIIN